MTPNQQLFPIRRVALILISGFLLALIIRPEIGKADYPTYVEPSLSAPAYTTSEVPEIINIVGPSTGSNVQKKLGSLMIGSSTDKKKLCLNPNLTASPGTSDTANCISSWADIGNIPGTGLLTKFKGIGPLPDGVTTNYFPPMTNVSAPTGYTSTPDVGYVGWQAIRATASQSQLFSFIAQTPSGTEDLAGRYAPAAIRAEVESDSQYAGVFSGTLGVAGITGGITGKICLNDTQPGGSCISHWADLTPVSQTVTLRDLKSSVGYGLDQGQTASAGTLVTDTVVAGQYCGDSFCQSPVETATSCTIDCH